jgi:cell division transport system permease protein
MIHDADINFAADDAHRFLPWLIGIMVCLAAILLCLALTINSWIIDRGGSYSNSFTVNIPAATDNLSEKLPKIREALQKTPGVIDVTRLSDGKLKDMLSPWLGGSDTLADLPLPAVLDVTLDGNTTINFTALQKSLAVIVPGTEVDAHERWVAAFSDFSATAQYLIAIFATLIIAAIAIMIAFTSRASLKLHSRTVHLLHSIGAADDYITRQFQQEAFLLVLPGAATGCIAAGLTYWATGIYMTSLSTSVIPSLEMALPHFFLLIALPVFCSAVAWGVARYSVTRQLQEVL